MDLIASEQYRESADIVSAQYEYVPHGHLKVSEEEVEIMGE